MVTLIDELSGKIVGAYKADKESLPEVFNRPMVMEVEGVCWRVVKAEPIRSKKLNLYVQEEGYFAKHNKRSMVPTMAVPRPKAAELRTADDFTLEIGLEEWRQIEFLPVAMQEMVQEEVKLIEVNMSDENLLGYDSVHMRENIQERALGIPLHEFYHLVRGREQGYIQLEREGVIEDGFFVRSKGHVYYGIEQGKYIRQLCLWRFDATDDELTELILIFDLMLIDWCGRQIIIP